jgi:hypothetical protein
LLERPDLALLAPEIMTPGRRIAARFHGLSVQRHQSNGPKFGEHALLLLIEGDTCLRIRQELFS